MEEKFDHFLGGAGKFQLRTIMMSYGTEHSGSAGTEDGVSATAQVQMIF